MEGIMCKKKGSRYQAGIRSNDWVKVKVRTSDEAVIIGYTKGQGDRAGLFGAMHLAKPIDEQRWLYMGKVGTGFNANQLNELMSVLIQIEASPKLISENIEEEYNTCWIKPTLWCEVNYASITPNGTYREPVFVRLREDI
jgi:bifunctional non-homologous end joining protein LigD